MRWNDFGLKVVLYDLVAEFQSFFVSYRRTYVPNNLA